MSETRAALLLLGFAILCYGITLQAAFVHRYYLMWWLPFLAVAGGGALREIRRYPRRKFMVVVTLVSCILLIGGYKARRRFARAAEGEAQAAQSQRLGALLPSDGTVIVLPDGHDNPWADWNAIPRFYLWRRVIDIDESGGPTLRKAAGNRGTAYLLVPADREPPAMKRAFWRSLREEGEWRLWVGTLSEEP